MKKLTTVTAYSIAMGYVESALVIYLREMISGSAEHVFPLRLLDPRLAVLETVRELATIVMIAMVGYLAGKDRFERGMYFVYSFAIWDITYYIVLKLAVGWPASLLTMDILFLIPVVWIGPVIAPVLIATLLSIAAVVLLRVHRVLPNLKIGRFNSSLFLTGSAVVLYSFTARIFHILFTSGPQGLEGYVPKTFDWLPFLTGYLIMCVAVLKTITDSFHKMRSVVSGKPG